jgi:hypothetical protein
MLFHQRYLLFKFQRIHPEIVTCAVSNIATSAIQQTVDVIIGYAFVVGVTEQTDLWESGSIVLTNGACAIRRGILSNHDLYGQMTLLAQDRVQCAGDGLLLMIGGNDNRDYVFHLSFAL